MQNAFMLDSLSNAPRTVAALTFGLLGFSALAAISYPNLPARQAAVCAEGDATATCNGNTWEKLICDDPIKLTKCFDAKTTCASWNVCDCCSPVPLHKCLSPLAGRAFDTDCSSPIDAREECCGDSATHLRAFQALADLGDDIEEAVSQAQDAAAVAQARATELMADASAAGTEALAQAQEQAEQLQEQAQALASRLSATTETE